MESQSSLEKMFSALSSQQSTRDNISNTALSSGITLFQKKKYKEAAAAFKQSKALKPDNIDAYNLLAQADLKLGNRKEAIEAYKISLKLDSTQDGIHVALANIYIEDKNFTEADKSLKAASRANTTNPLPYYTRGHLLLQMDKPAEAETAFRQAVRLAPKDGNAYYGLGKAMNEQGKSLDAVYQLNKAMELKKNFAPAMFELGSAYYNSGKEDKVQSLITTLKALDSAEGDAFAQDLEKLIQKPRMTGVTREKSTFDTSLGVTSLIALDSSLIQPASSKEFTMTFAFDTEMDVSSVANIGNWKISRSNNMAGGLYDNGLYRDTDRSASTSLPNRVIYNPVSREATIFFSIYQNEPEGSPLGTGTIDTSRLNFKFQGKSVTGKSMDLTADEFTGYANKVF